MVIVLVIEIQIDINKECYFFEQMNLSRPVRHAGGDFSTDYYTNGR
jgi:hypothetical protein